MEYSEIKWEDVENFLLPTGNYSTAELSQKLSEIHNYAVFVSQYEPELKTKISMIDVEINRLRDQMARLVDSGRMMADQIPQDKRKNKDIMDSYIKTVMFKGEYEQLLNKYNSLVDKRLRLQSKYDEVMRRIKIAKQALDTGRTILSAMKEEFKNLPLE